MRRTKRERRTSGGPGEVRQAMNLASKLSARAPREDTFEKDSGLPPVLLTLVGSSAGKFGAMVLLRLAAIAAAVVACLPLPMVAIPAILTGTRLTPV